MDVYTVPVGGGAADPADVAPGPRTSSRASRPDGTAVLFTSQRAVFTSRYSQLFTVPVDGRLETPLEIPTRMARHLLAGRQADRLQPALRPFLQWKHYRGGTQLGHLDLHRRATSASSRSRSRRAAATMSDPMWIGDIIYFRSDRNGEFNLFAFDTKTKTVKQLTRHEDFPVLDASAAAGRSSTSRPATCTCSIPRTGKPREADDRRGRRPRRAAARDSSRARATSATRRCRPRAPGRLRVPRRDRDACRPRRATRAT